MTGVLVLAGISLLALFIWLVVVLVSPYKGED